MLEHFAMLHHISLIGVNKFYAMEPVIPCFTLDPSVSFTLTTGNPGKHLWGDALLHPRSVCTEHQEGKLVLPLCSSQTALAMSRAGEIMLTYNHVIKDTRTERGGLQLLGALSKLKS